MQKNTLNFIVDLLAAILMIPIAATGVLLWLVMPPGSRGGHGLTLWGWDRHQFGDLHLYLALTLVALVLLHVALHWTWVWMTVASFFKPRVNRPPATRKNIVGLIAMLLSVGLVVAFLLVADANITRGPDDDHGAEHGARGQASSAAGIGGMGSSASESGDGHGLRLGQRTVREAAGIAGLSVTEFCERVGLPPDTDPGAQLGPLRHEHALDDDVLHELLE